MGVSQSVASLGTFQYVPSITLDQITVPPGDLSVTNLTDAGRVTAGGLILWGKTLILFFLGGGVGGNQWQDISSRGHHTPHAEQKV